MAIKGADVLVLVDTATSGNPVWRAVAGQRGATLHMETETLDVTTKDSEGAMREVLATFNSWSVSCDGLVVEDDSALEKLREAWRNREKVKVRVKIADDDIEGGEAIISSIDLEAPFDESFAYSCELSGAGPLVKATP